MSFLFIYIIKANIVLTLFFIAYQIGLKKLTFYTINRIYLTFATIFSSIIPLFNIVPILSINKTVFQRANLIAINWNQLQQINAANNNLKATWSLNEFYLIVVFIFFVRLLIKLLSITNIHKNSTKESYDSIPYQETNLNISPFSFGNKIYCNSKNYSDEQFKSILKHEYIHVKEWHCLDILLSEIANIFFWFNPFVWCMNSIVKENLEFITDRKILEIGFDCKKYQYDLLNVSSLIKISGPVHNFNYLTIKKRIAMMNKKQSSILQISKYFLFIPLILVLSLTINVSKAQLNEFGSVLIYKIDTVKNSSQGIPIVKDYKKAGLIVTTNLGRPNSDYSNFVKTDANTGLKTKEQSLYSVQLKRTEVNVSGEQKLVIGHAPQNIVYFIDGIKADNYDNIEKDRVFKIQVLDSKDSKKLLADSTVDQIIIITTKENKDSNAVRKLDTKLQNLSK